MYCSLVADISCLCVLWSHRVTNGEVFQRAKEERLLVKLLKNRCHSWIGHTVREIGHTVREIGHTVREIGHTVGEIGHTVGEIGHTVREIGHTVREIGHTVREIGHTVREIGHTVRHNEFVVNILEGAIFGKNAAGRPGLQYLKQVDRNRAADSYTAMERMACNSCRWKAANQSTD